MIKKSPFILIIVLLVLVDQFLKCLIIKYLANIVSPNYGVLFGWINNPMVILLVLILGFCALVWMVKKLDLSKPLLLFALVLIFSGAISNVFDRILRGYVIDYIYLGLWPTFNLADIYIFSGVVLLIYEIFINNVHKKIDSTKGRFFCF